MRLYRVTYVDSLYREAFVEARDRDEAERKVALEFYEGICHHAFHTHQDEFEAEPVKR